MDRKLIGRAIKSYMVEHGISNTEAAAKVGVTPQALSGFITGTKALGRQTAAKFAAAFGFSETYLLTGDGSLVPEKGQEDTPDGRGIFISREKLVEWLDNLTEAVSIQAQMLERRQGALIDKDKERKYLAHK